MEKRIQKPKGQVIRPGLTEYDERALVEVKNLVGESKFGEQSKPEVLNVLAQPSRDEILRAVDGMSEQALHFLDVTLTSAIDEDIGVAHPSLPDAPKNPFIPELAGRVKEKGTHH